MKLNCIEKCRSWNILGQLFKTIVKRGEYRVEKKLRSILLQEEDNRETTQEEQGEFWLDINEIQTLKFAKGQK